MIHAPHTGYQEQHFLNLEGLDGISPTQVAEHLALYVGYVKQVNALNAQLAVLRAEGRASDRDRVAAARAGRPASGCGRLNPQGIGR